MYPFARLACCFLLAMFPLAAIGAPRQQPRAVHPQTNVILITIDTLRADHLGCYGYKDIHTPNIDALAASGTRFENAFAAVPVTLPSHTTIMTGTYPMYTGMHDFSGNKLSPQVPTLASVLRSNGYATGAIIGAAVLDSRFGLNSGFDFYYDHFNVRPLREADLDETERQGNAVMDQALDWLRKNQQHRFFLWIHLYDPHYPYHPPAPYNEEYKDRLYDGEIAFADSQLGRLIEFLRQNRLYDQALIALTGDHGEGLGEHGEKTHGFFIYNSTMHVPLIFKLPARKMPANQTTTVRANRGEKISSPAILVDIMPTILDELNITAPSDVQGHSLLPLIEGKRPAAKTEEQTVSDIYGESFLPRLHFNWSELRGIEIGNLHFIAAPKPEIYDLSSDPRELHNLYSQKGAVAAEYQRKLAEVGGHYTSDHSVTEETGLDPQLVERLKSLGYAAVSGGGDPTISNRELPDPKDRIQTYELISAAIEDSQHGRFQPSIEKLGSALKSEPSSIPVHYLLGLNYFRERNFDAAVPEFETVVKLDPSYALALGDLGEAYGHLGENEKAVDALKRALQADPTNFAAAFNLGVVYLNQQMVPQAVASFQQSIGINPDYANPHRALGQVWLSSGQAAQSAEEFRIAVRLQPNDPSLHALLAKALEANGLTTEAAAELQRAQELANAPEK